MGMFDSGPDPNDQINDLLNQQLAADEAEKQAKRESYFQQQMAIVKSSGSQNWTPDRSTPVSQPSRATSSKSAFSYLSDMLKGMASHG